MASDSDGRISRVTLKSRSGEFDLDSIYTLNLRDLGISDLGCVGECGGLERLDLSRNDVTRLYALASLTNLITLNLSANRISSLEGLQALDSLQTLNLAGNLVSGLDSLRCLTGLEKLQDLRLKDTVKDLSNPLCMSVSYRTDVLALFPRLLVLDGERLSGKGSELFKMCEDLDKMLEVSPDHKGEMEATPLPVDWVPEGFWDIKSTQFDQSNLSDAEQQLELLLESCKHLSQQATAKLQDATLKTS